MESTDSSTGGASQRQPHLPPGFRFHPTDEELVVHYLKKKAASIPIPVPIIAEVDLYKFDPWELPEKAVFGEQEWYFFSPRDRKYPNGARPNRAATSGYWKATGTDKPVLTAGGTQKVGVKKALVFYGGKPPKGVKTNWIMHEYRLADNKPNNRPPGCDLSNKKASLRLDDWVLCRIYKKINALRSMDLDRDDMNDMMTSIPSCIPPTLSIGQHNKLQGLKASSFGTLHLENEHNLFDHDPQFGSRPELPFLKPHHSPALPPAKRALPGLYWNDECTASSPPTKRFLDDGISGRGDDQSSSMATLFSQMPQPASIHQQAMLGALGDGVFRQSYGMNWYS